MKKYALITGASRGIGAGVAHYFASCGYHLILIARDEAALNKVKTAILAKTPDIDITIKALDVSYAEKTYAEVKACIADKGRVDVVFNNAGILTKGTTDISIADFQHLHNVNLSGIFAVAKAAAEVMKKQQSGYIFNLASLAGKRAIAPLGAYASSKFAVVGFSDALYKELMPDGIKVTSLCPSVINTDMTRSFDMANNEKIQIDDIIKTIDYLLSLSPAAVMPTIDIHCKAIVQAGM